MAFIYKPPKQKNNNKDINKEIAQKYVYNTPTWKSLRLVKLIRNPLCEECLNNDHIEPAVEVHHIQPFLTGSNLDQIKWLGFDYSNLMSLCEKCHDALHKNNLNV
jgi:5-methylcytosine-specific restriction enzyme A